ncbi:MAG: hypothetical protein WBO55_10295 [Rhizobiaceae bacterium]
MGRVRIRKADKMFGYTYTDDDGKDHETKAKFDSVDDAIAAVGEDKDIPRGSFDIVVDDEDYIAAKSKPALMQTFVSPEITPSTVVAAEVTEVPPADADGASNDASATPGAKAAGKGAGGSQTRSTS